jgi:hypothetical protein
MKVLFLVFFKKDHFTEYNTLFKKILERTALGNERFYMLRMWVEELRASSVLASLFEEGTLVPSMFAIYSTALEVEATTPVMRLPPYNEARVCSVIGLLTGRGKLGAVALLCHQVKDYRFRCGCRKGLTRRFLVASSCVDLLRRDLLERWRE